MTGTLYVVGLGPGDRADMSARALQAVAASDVVVGYKTYLDLVRDLLADKDVISSGMKSELHRAEQAIGLAREGKAVSVISSGDPGIYGMAGPVLELLGNDPDVAVEIVPGITALSSAAASLGAPLMHDFCAISLSDLLTPWELILRRLEAAASADFVTALYNPRSRGRTHQILAAQEIFLAHRDPDTPVGTVRNARRGDEVSRISTLKTLDVDQIDMLTTVVIGNSQSRLVNGRFVTPRGYPIAEDALQR